MEVVTKTEDYVWGSKPPV